MNNRNVSTVGVERSTALNVHGFNPIEVFAEISSHYFGQKCLLFSIIKERYLYSRINFHGFPKNHGNLESLVQ